MKNLVYLSLLLLMASSSCKKDSGTATIVYQDALTTDKQTWEVDSGSYYVREFTQGHYAITVDTLNRIIFSLAPYSSVNYPYTVQVDGTTILDTTSLLGNVAVVFNYTDNIDFTVAEIWTNGTYRIWTRVNGNTSTLVDYTFSNAINAGSGSKNTIKLIQEQATAQLMVNNVSMGTFNIALPSGLVQTGPAVATDIYEFTPETGLFNNFSIAKN